MPTSAAGRFQFSTEKAYSVSTSRPSRAEVSTTDAHRVDPGAVPLDSRQVTLPRPAAVAVHDDGDVARQPLGVELACKLGVGAVGRQPLEESVRIFGTSNNRNIRY